MLLTRKAGLHFMQLHHVDTNILSSKGKGKKKERESKRERERERESCIVIICFFCNLIALLSMHMYMYY